MVSPINSYYMSYYRSPLRQQRGYRSHPSLISQASKLYHSHEALYMTPPNDTAVPRWTIRQALQIIRQILPTSDLSYENLNRMSVAWLPYQERAVVYYLRRNPSIFHLVQELSSQYPDRPNWFNTMTLDNLKGDVSINRQAQSPHNTAVERPAFESKQPQRDIESLFQKLQEQIPRGAPPTAQSKLFAGVQALPVGALGWLSENPNLTGTFDLNESERERLDVLLQPSVLRVMNGLARNQQMLLTPDVIRILVSLLFNPMIHGTVGLPLSIFEARPEPDLEDEEAVTEIDTEMMSELNLQEPHDTTLGVYQRIELSAQQIRELCRHLKASGGITLEEFQEYKPLTDIESKLLRLLRQHRIFHAIADLDGKDMTLDPSDIRQALESHSVLLNEDHIELVFNP